VKLALLLVVSAKKRYPVLDVQLGNDITPFRSVLDVKLEDIGNDIPKDVLPELVVVIEIDPNTVTIFPTLMY